MKRHFNNSIIQSLKVQNTSQNLPGPSNSLKTRSRSFHPPFPRHSWAAANGRRPGGSWSEGSCSILEWFSASLRVPKGVRGLGGYGQLRGGTINKAFGVLNQGGCWGSIDRGLPKRWAGLIRGVLLGLPGGFEHTFLIYN